MDRGGPEFVNKERNPKHQARRAKQRKRTSLDEEDSGGRDQEKEKAEKGRFMEEDRMEGRAGGETRVKGREPALKGLSPPWQEIKGKQPQGGFQELGPLPGDSFQRHPWVSLTPRSRRRRRGICKVPPCSIKWEHLLAPLGPGAQSVPLPLPPGPSSSLLTPHYLPLPCPDQGGAQVKLKAGRGPGTFCSFLHHWLPDQECVMSPVWSRGCRNAVTESQLRSQAGPLGADLEPSAR